MYLYTASSSAGEICPSKICISDCVRPATSGPFGCPDATSFFQFTIHALIPCSSPAHLPRTPSRSGPVEVPPMIWQLAHLALKTVLPSCAETFIKQKMKKEAKSNKRFGAKDFSGIIETIDL